MKTLEGRVEWDFQDNENRFYLWIDEHGYLSINTELQDFHGKKVKITIEEVTRG